MFMHLNVKIKALRVSNFIEILVLISLIVIPIQFITPAMVYSYILLN